jgi:chloramphenicol 3-O-phosphotransferase
MPPMHCVFIHGPVASGKLTVATELQSLAGLPLHHNHFAVDTALSLFPFGSPGFVRLREQLWLSVFRAASAAAESFIFTFAPESSVRPELIDALVNTVAAVGGRVLFVELTCSEAEIERRVVAASRAQHRKLNSLGLYRELREKGAFEFPPLPAPIISVATDELTPHEAAAAIHAHVKRTLAAD